MTVSCHKEPVNFINLCETLETATSGGARFLLDSDALHMGTNKQICTKHTHGTDQCLWFYSLSERSHEGIRYPSIYQQGIHHYVD